ncbi:MAG: AraC family transcriptional regulator, partial [Halieaceae bacterium]|nr:AraC family transcriptional regulator [Halieaceae bacterium]
GVAVALGYDDQLYFSRQFSKTVGLSPRAYRRSVRG